MEEGICKLNPALSHAPGVRSLVPRHRRLPWIPTEEQWSAILAATRQEPMRNRLIAIPETGDSLAADAVCFIDIPVNKTSTEYTKPVDRVVGEAITAWERVRPSQEKRLDPKTGELVQFLFSCGRIPVGKGYLNKRLIPILCKKAGIPACDVRGRITSHRARSTIASQLFNAKEPMGLFELQQFLGHASPASTQRYLRITPTKLAKSYSDAGYFARNIRAVEVLIDQDAVRSGIAATEPWKFYDLGQGYCTYDFFDQCPYRMACAKCDFYLPKESSRAQISKPRKICSSCARKFPSRTTSSQQFRMASPHTRTC